MNANIQGDFQIYIGVSLKQGCCTLDVIRTASYEIILDHLAVRLLVRPSVRHYIFLRLDHYFFLMLYMMIADHDILELTKPYFLKNTVAAQIWAKQAKIGSETRLFTIFSSLVYQFFLKFHTMIACNNVQHLVQVKPTKRNLEAQIWAKQAKIGPKIFLAFSEIWFFSFPLA